MFKDEPTIYQHLAKIIVKAIPDPLWIKAELEVMSHNGSKYITLKSRYYSPSSTKTNYFNPYITGTENIETATAELYRARYSESNEKPFNKYKFALNNDGTFDIEFKYDEDFAYMKSLDADSDEFDELLELDVTDQIESWERLPQDHPRPWLNLNV